MSEQKCSVSRFELLMDAGFGAQKAGDILIRAFAHTKKFVYIEPMIPAEISPPARTKPALSGVIIRVADRDLTNIGNYTDVILAQHEIVLDRRLDDQEHGKECHILLDMGDQKKNEESYEATLKRVAKLGYKVEPIHIVEEAQDLLKQMAGKGKNMYYLGILSEIYSMPENVMIDEITAMFGKKLKPEILQKNIEIFHLGHKFASENIDYRFLIEGKRETDQEQMLIDGNTALSMGIIDSGFKLISGYPITPASSILHVLARTFPSYGGIVHQAEDEISAIGTAIGSYFTGKPAVTCSSGPGISLKQEFIGYAAVAEVPLVIIDVQRSGPSTGMPTKTEQSDLFSATFGSHGDNTKVILGVANVTDCFYAPHVARYIAEKLRLPVFIMSDFSTANSYKVIDKLPLATMNDINDIPDFVLERFRLKRLPETIEMVRTHQDNPGTQDKMRRVTGLNTDETGKVNYFSASNQRSHRIRNDKINHVRQSLVKPETFGDENAETLIVGWGSTRGAIEEAVVSANKKGLSVAGMYFRVVSPLPANLKELFSKYSRVYTVETAYGDENKSAPFAYMLRAETLVDVQALICGATGRPIQPVNIVERLKEELHVAS